MSRIYQVSEITAAIKGLLEGNFPFVWVQGQIFNLACPASGHLYFSLKDEAATLSAVWFKGNQQSSDNFDPLTGEVFADGPRPSLAARLRQTGLPGAFATAGPEGLEVICAGSLSVYPPRGNYQLLVELMQEAGKGRLRIEFELLKAELAAKGYFDPQRKRALPRNPLRVAVVTSPSGAAIHDFLRLAGSRGLSGEIRLYPTLVQGEAAPAQIAAALSQVSEQGWAEVVVLIRGGGSLEDLWAFNSREVARAVFESRPPVLSGVGHEVDVTLADLVADLRAATPSHAAQLLWPERRELAQSLDELEISLSAAWRLRLKGLDRLLQTQEKILRLLSPAARLERHADELKSGLQRLLRSGPARLAQAEREFSAALQAFVPQWSRGCRELENALERQELRMAGLDPQLPLRRGYALVRRPDGSFLRSCHEALSGDNLELCLVDGTVPVVVTE